MSFFLNLRAVTRYAYTAFIICFIGYSHVMLAQTECVLIEDINIVDNETQIISFTIAGVQVDDLADPNQAISSIQIEFEHDKVTDLEVSLMSPSNQEVRLIGPVTNSNVLTSGVLGWAIEFVPCTTPAQPDPRINQDVYSNLLDWANLTFYNGSYHPSNGCLEDFNIGPVNGKWTIVVGDGFRFDDGSISSIKIVFAEPTGLDFSVCEANAGVLQGNIDFDNPIPICDFMDDLELFNFMITNERNADNEYNYEFIIADLITEDIIAVQEDRPDLRSNIDFPLGDYQICGLSYNVDDRAVIFDELDNGNLIDFRDFINTIPSPVCADVMETCLTISKLPIANFVQIDTTICSGGEFRLEDSNGLLNRYIGPIENDSLKFGAEACDSVVIVTVQQIEIEAIISTDTDTIINCASDTLVLGSSMSVVDGPPERLWSTIDGEILGDNTMQQIMTNTPGTYTLMISTDQGCMDMTSIVIGQNMDQAVVNLMEDGIITCENSVVEISASSQENLFNPRWQGPDVDAQGFTTQVFDEGMYTFTADFENGCSFEDSILVEKDIDIPAFTVEPILVGCRARLEFTNNMIPQGAMWITPSDVVLDEVMPIVSEQGVYELIVESQNGCIDTVDVDIQFEPPIDMIQIVGSDLTCADTSTVLSVASQTPFELVSWEGPDDFFELLDSVTVSTLGTYTVRTQDSDNCPGIGVFELQTDTIQPFIEISGSILGCTAASTTLTADIAGLSSPIEWEGPNFQDAGFDVLVAEVGQYTAMTTGENGCLGIDTFLLSREEPFNVNVNDTLINCDLSAVQVEAQISIVPEQIQWDGPDGFSATDPIIDVNQTGTYFLTVTGPGRCNVVDTLQVGLRSAEISFSGSDDFVIDCEADSVQLSLDIVGTAASIFFISESLDILPGPDPVVYEAGIYQVEAEDAFGCPIDTSIVVRADTLSPTVVIDRVGTFVCEQNEVTLTANVGMVGSPIVLWLGENGPLPDQENLVQTVDEPGTYTVRVFNPSNFCLAQQEITLVEEDNSFTDLEVDFVNPCGDQPTGVVQVINFVGGEGPYELSIDSVSFEETNQIGGLPVGSYELFARDVNGCTFSEAFDIEQAPELNVTLPEEISVMFNDLVELGIDTTGLNIIDIFWGQDNQFLIDGVDSINFQAQNETTIQLFLRTREGCESSTSVDVLVTRVSTDIHLPTAFRPSSEVNGLFQFGVNQGIITVLELNIFDRWGNRVYRVANAAANSDYGWNGMFNGELAEQDTYVYWADLQSIEGEVERVNGTFYLFR